MPTQQPIGRGANKTLANRTELGRGVYLSAWTGLKSRVPGDSEMRGGILSEGIAKKRSCELWYASRM